MSQLGLLGEIALYKQTPLSYALMILSTLELKTTKLRDHQRPLKTHLFYAFSSIQLESAFHIIPYSEQ